MAERAGERLVRLLGMVAYLGQHTSVPVAELAEHFGVSTAQILEDIDLLWVTGTPGYMHGDLIDFDVDSLERGFVRLTEDKGLARPLRLGVREASALVSALRALSDDLSTTLDGNRAAAITSTLAVLERALGEQGGGEAALDVHLAVDDSSDVLPVLMEAVQRGRRLRIRYVDSADVVTDRLVDPINVETGSERTYLHAWCLTAGGERSFRVDRVLAATLTDIPVDDHPLAEQRPDPGTGGSRVVLHLRSRGRWIAEQIPHHEVVELDDGEFTIAIDVTDEAWLRSLVLRAAESIVSVEPASWAVVAATTARRALSAYDVAG